MQIYVLLRCKKKTEFNDLQEQDDSLDMYQNLLTSFGRRKKTQNRCKNFVFVYNLRTKLYIVATTCLCFCFKFNSSSKQQQRKTLFYIFY